MLPELDCPSVTAIKSAGLSYASSGSNGYTVAQLNNYSTRNTWVFGFTAIDAPSSAANHSIIAAIN